MKKSKQLTKRQLAVLDGLFGGRSAEQTVLKNHKVPRKRYEQWFAEKHFAQEFERRVHQAYRQSRMIMARNAPVAANKLVKLTSSEKEETARKACLDVITPRRPAHTVSHEESQSPAPDLPPEQASRLLAALTRKDV